MLILLFLCILNYVLCSTEMVIILGCNNDKIQNQRINIGIQYLLKSSIDKILYLSGGIKYGLINGVSESTKMYQKIEKKNIDVDIILDNMSKNTAQNFVNMKKWVNKNILHKNVSYTVITSDYHKNRVQKLFDGIFVNIKAKILLSKSDCKQCWIDEKIHSKNIKSDIMDALIHIN